MQDHGTLHNLAQPWFGLVLQPWTYSGQKSPTLTTASPKLSNHVKYEAIHVKSIECWLVAKKKNEIRARLCVRARTRMRMRVRLPACVPA